MPEEGALLRHVSAPEERREGDAVALDLASMRDLDAYDDEYLEPPDWDKSLTDLEEARVKRHGKSSRSSKTENSFGKKGVALDDEGE